MYFCFREYMHFIVVLFQTALHNHQQSMHNATLMKARNATIAALMRLIRDILELNESDDKDEESQSVSKE